MKRLLKTNPILILAFLILFAACEKEKDERTKTDGKFDRTLFLYMIADNKLASFGISNIKDIVNAGSSVDLYYNNIVIYYDPYNDVPRLMEVKKNSSGVAVLDTLETYKERNSASVDVLSEMVDRVREKYPSEKYGLIFWGHGSTWLPANWFYDTKSAFRMQTSSSEPELDIVRTPVGDIPTKVYGGDDGKWLGIDDIKEALPDHVFDYILFDVCYMAGVEVVYELKDKANYIMASAAEVLGAGFPYPKVVGPFLSKEPDLENIAKTYYEHYNAQSGAYQSATISLIKTSALDQLASKTKELLGNNPDAISAPLTGLQAFDRQYTPKIMYDMANYMESVVSESDYESFVNVLRNAVVYENATSWMLQGSNGFPVHTHSGLTIFPYHTLNYLSISQNYKQTDWYKAVYE